MCVCVSRGAYDLSSLFIELRDTISRCDDCEIKSPINILIVLIFGYTDIKTLSVKYKCVYSTLKFSRFPIQEQNDKCPGTFTSFNNDANFAIHLVCRVRDAWPNEENTNEHVNICESRVIATIFNEHQDRYRASDDLQ